MLIHLNNSISLDDFLMDLEKEKIKLNSISSYDIHHRKSYTLIIGYTNIDEENLKKALAIIKEKIEHILCKIFSS